MAALRIPIVRNTSYRLNGPKSYAYALNKYGISLDHHTAISKMFTKDETTGKSTVISADNIMNDSFYTCPVEVGGQVVNLDLDSGSADTWIWSTQLPQQIQQVGKENHIKMFDPKKSSTFKPLPGYSWKISYGDGSGASGDVGTDTVKIGNIKVEGQMVELADKVSSAFQNTTSSGLLGLSFGHINTVMPKQAKTPVENMIEQKTIEEALWSVYLGSVKDINDPDHGKSFFTFGGYDSHIVEASGQEISWTKVDSTEGFWMFPSISASVNGEKIELHGNRAMADTGTTLMLVSDQLCAAVYAAVPGAIFDKVVGGWIIPVNNVEQRPDVKIAIGDNLCTIEKEHLGWSKVNEEMVFGAIQSRGNNPFDILGDTFLICCYAIFDVSNKRFGFVQRADPTPSGK